MAILFIFTSCKKEYSAEDLPIPPVVKDHNILLKFRAVINDTVPLVLRDLPDYRALYAEPVLTARDDEGFACHVETLLSSPPHAFATNNDTSITATAPNLRLMIED